MKKIFSITIALVMAFSMMCLLSSCGEQKGVDEQFMESLAKGLEARWVLTDQVDESGSEDTEEDWKAYFDAEYNEISQFKDQEFENADLGKWAKRYIDSIEGSKDALRYFGTDQWYTKYSNDVYQDRVEAIYKINAITPIEVSEENEGNLKELLINGEVSSTAFKLMDTVKFKKINDDYGWKTYEAIVENPCSADFSYFDFSVALIDEDGVTLDTMDASVEHWNSGEKAKFEFETDEDFDKMELKYASWDF